MINICKVDSMLVFTGDTMEHDGKSAIPKGWIAVDAPEWKGVFQWAGSKWNKLSEYPKAIEQKSEIKKAYDPDKLIKVIDGMGKLDDFEKILSLSPARIRLRWQKATQFAEDDADFAGMVEAIASAWKLSEKDTAEILRQCEI